VDALMFTDIWRDVLDGGYLPVNRDYSRKAGTGFQ